jgi:hypothetical protein
MMRDVSILELLLCPPPIKVENYLLALLGDQLIVPEIELVGVIGVGGAKSFFASGRDLDAARIGN